VVEERDVPVTFSGTRANLATSPIRMYVLNESDLTALLADTHGSRTASSRLSPNGCANYVPRTATGCEWDFGVV
jgi:hypothetical protein